MNTLSIHDTHTSLPATSLWNYFVEMGTSDCGPTTQGNTFDEFLLTLERKPIARLRVEYDEDQHQTTLRLVEMDPEACAAIPFCANSQQLAAAMMQTVLAAFEAGMEFYHEAFVNDDGDERGHPLILMR